MTRLLALVAYLTASASAFTIVPRAAFQLSSTSLNMVDPNLFIEQASSLMLAETEPWVQPLSLVLDPFLNLFSFAMVRDFTHDEISSFLHFQFLSRTHNSLSIWFWYICVTFIVVPHRLELVPHNIIARNAVDFGGMAH